MPRVHPRNKHGFSRKFKYCPHHDIDSLSSPDSFAYKVKCKKGNKKPRLECKQCNNNDLKNWMKNNKEHYKKWRKEYDLINKDKVDSRRRRYQKNRLLRDSSFKLRRNLRRRIWGALKENTKSDSTIKLIGCSIDELKKHLESKFQDGMDWNNYGVWHVDHIIGCANFDLSDPKQQQICFHYTNLQPMWGEHNRQKGSRLI